MFNNLLYILVVIVALETRETTHVPSMPWLQTLSIFLLKGVLFWLSLRVYLMLRKIRASADYFRAESTLSVLAVLVFLGDVYLLDLHYYLGLLPFIKQMPVLASLTGLALFYSYLVLVWLSLRKDYENTFTVTRPARTFLVEQFRNSAVVVMPWLILSLLYGVLMLVPIPAWQIFLAGDWGEPVVFIGYLVTLPFWLPGLLVKMMGCRPLPPGEERGRIEAFCLQQRVGFGEIYSWPLFGGRVLSAGVLGFVGRFRYLLLTPALLEVAKAEELEAVLAHEIGHVKKHHLLLYLLLFMAFGILLQFALEPMLQALMGSQFLLTLLFSFEGDPSTLAPFFVGIPLLVALLFYVRFIFGFFMRNFERQADLYSYRVMRGAGPLVSILEKIAWLGGNIRERPSWHHFGIGQRVDYLKGCEEGKRKPIWHELKVYGALGAFAVGILGVVVTTWQLGNYIDLAAHPGAEFAEGFVASKVATEPNNPLWLHLSGDMLAGQKRYDEAIAAYEKSLSFQPNNPEVLNNLAWLCLTAEKKGWRDPVRALELARRAVAINARSHILDTLAEAQWQNGESAQAVATERRALEGAKENREYYRGQLEKFVGIATSRDTDG
jgi:Zn-dependent protease with chaperone function